MAVAAVTSGQQQATVDYCRQARRLRGRLGGQPSRLHQALRRLNDAAPVTRPAVLREPAIPVTVCPAALLGVPVDREAAVRRFVDHVRATLTVDPLVSHDVRKNLLRTADRLQIERFHANLVIAALLHEVAKPSARVTPPATSSRFGLVLAAVATQAFIVIAAILAWTTV